MFRSKISQVLIATMFSVPAVGLVGTQNALANANYGAMAYSVSTGSHGYSYDYATPQQATNVAIRFCEQYAQAGDCKSLVVFKNGCGALARASDYSAGSGWGANRAAAESYALQSCQRYGPNCKVIRWVCTSR